jgi:hypothetical protein
MEGGLTMQASRTGLDREVLVLGGVVVLGMALAILDATIVTSPSPRSEPTSARRSPRSSGS